MPSETITRRSTRPRSLMTLAVMPVLALAMLLGFAPTAAAAAPAPADTAAAPAPMTGGWNVGARDSGDGQTRVAADFTCNYFSRFPFHVVDFTCAVRSGTMRVYLICLGGHRVNSRTLGPGFHNVRLSCPGVRVDRVGWESLS